MVPVQVDREGGEIFPDVVHGHAGRAHGKGRCHSDSRKDFLGHGVGVRVPLVQMFLDDGNQSLDLSPIIDIDQELREGPVLPFRAVDLWQ